MRERKRIEILYIIIVLLICLLPSAGLLVADSGESTSENRTLSEFPSVMQDGELNLNWLPEAGEYFQEHFALRSELVNLNAQLMSAVLGVSADDGVVDGTDGWLYYSDSLDDYLGRNLLDERSLFNIARCMKQMQEYAQSQDMQFLYVPVPNKNTLYGEHMPYYYQYKASDDRNLERLYVVLEEQGVNYLNLLEIFSQEEDTLYHLRDSHWTNQGAALAADLILEAVGRETLGIAESDFEIRTDFVGDLQEMLYPLSEEMEEEIYYHYEFFYDYVNEISSTFDPKIQTVNQAADGGLIMYRDSFGNALLPFVAEGFGAAYFSRSVPYPMTDLSIYQADTLIVERAERFLSDTAQNPPIMQGIPLGALPEDAVQVGAAAFVLDESSGDESEQWNTSGNGVVLTEEGMYHRIDGMLNSELCSTESLIYVVVNGTDVYEALPVTGVTDAGEQNSYGYRLYLPRAEVQEYSIEIFVSETEADLLAYEATEEAETETEASETELAVDFSILEAAG